ncbi:hypothetical protein BJY52DRAFT_96740 [Lactarius psammicola]|nr:hypothetical protein BJY52DRAFT_96740 [Lactarius psammicola]
MTWVTNEAMLPSIQVLGSDFLAPYSLSLFISALETGVIIVCFARFMARRADAESYPIKLLVYFLTCASLFQTGATFATWWKIFVVDFGNWRAAAVPAWPQKIHTSMTTLLAAPVQLFLTWRCWHLLKRKWFIALPLVLMVIGTIVTTIWVVTILFRIQFASKGTLAVQLHTFFTCFAVCVAFSAAIDIFVTGILLVFLIRSRSKVYTRRFRKVLSQLIGITWESAVPPCACALAALIVSMRGAPFISYWAVMLQTILGKLEGRAKLSDATNLTHFPTLTNTSRLDRRWSVPREESDQTDPTQGSHVPVHLALVPCKSGTADDTAVEGSAPGLFIGVCRLAYTSFLASCDRGSIIYDPISVRQAARHHDTEGRLLLGNVAPSAAALRYRQDYIGRSDLAPVLPAPPPLGQQSTVLYYTVYTSLAVAHS